MRKYYFDDEDEGSSPETSHPTYVKLFPDDFFYSCVEEFGPFGSDAGADALSMLEDWFQEPQPGSMLEYIDEHLEGWGFTLPDLRASDEASVRAWTADEIEVRKLYDIDALIVGTVFGHFKITGNIDAGSLPLAEAAAARRLILAKHLKVSRPTWEHADRMIDGAKRTLEALAKMRALGKV